MEKHEVVKATDEELVSVVLLGLERDDDEGREALAELLVRLRMLRGGPPPQNDKSTTARA